MPTVHVISQRKNERKLMDLIFPCKTHPSAPRHALWDWPELRVGSSFIQGCGRFPRRSSDFSSREEICVAQHTRHFGHEAPRKPRLRPRAEAWGSPHPRKLLDSPPRHIYRPPRADRTLSSPR